MTTPMFDTVRTIPLIIEKDVPLEAQNVDSGFPFDREDRGDRDDHLRSKLDDLAKRHPEFAEHFEGFPFRTDSLGRRRPPRPSEPSEFRRFTDRPFGSSRFERFGFPFNNDPFEENFAEAKPQPAAAAAPEPQTPQKQEEEEDKPKPGRGRKQNIQQSNTVDLGQKQEPVNDRNQRSMSAPPPDNRQRYVSSIHIPINRDGGMGDMGKAQSQQQQEKPVNKPTERVIPIHVEGRDEPVVPKNTGPSFTQPQPQTERIFGHSPSHFTQFVGRESPRTFTAGPEWHHSRFEPEARQQQKFQQQTPPPQQPQKFQQSQPAQKPQEPQQEPQQEQQQPKSNDSIDIIQSIQKDVSALMGEVEKFAGMPRDKQYLYLDEMLTRNLIKLDNIDTQGQENIRQARKEAIKCIEGCIGILEAKAAANVPQQKQQEEEVKEVVSESKPEEPQDKMEVEAKEEKVEAPCEEKTEAAPIAVEETMELPEEPKKEEVKEEKASETSEIKPDEEMKEVAPESETSKGEVKEENLEEASEDKKDKKGKKKVVKK